MEFDPKDRVKALLWCDRHCCLCGKQCGVNIVLHHIDPQAESGKNSLDNAIPLCFECHGAVGHYNDDHPLGAKLKPAELKKRRDQMYEQFTSRLVPKVLFELTQRIHVPDENARLGTERRALPDVGFTITHCDSTNPVKALVWVTLPDGAKVSKSGYYNGERLWHLNPGTRINGHFLLETDYHESELTLCVKVTLVDCWEREHRLLPLAHTFMPSTCDWYLEPSPPEAR